MWFMSDEAFEDEEDYLFYLNRGKDQEIEVVREQEKMVG